MPNTLLVSSVIHALHLQENIHVCILAQLPSRGNHLKQTTHVKGLQYDGTMQGVQKSLS